MLNITGLNDFKNVQQRSIRAVIGHYFVNPSIKGDAFGQNHFDAESKGEPVHSLVNHVEDLGVLA